MYKNHCGKFDDLVAIHKYEFYILIGHLAKNVSKIDFCQFSDPKPLYHKDNYMIFEVDYYNSWVDNVLKKVAELENSELYYYINNFEIDFHEIITTNLPKAIDVKKLREETGCGMMECKYALERFNNDFEFAKEFLVCCCKRGWRDQWCIQSVIKKLNREPNTY